MKNKKKIFFRADASHEIGYGHFVRSLALADMLKDEFDCTFFTQTPNIYQKEEVAKVCRLIELPSDETKFQLFLEYICGDEIVFFDNYFFTPEYELKVKNKGCKLVSLAPYDAHHYSDILINYIEKDLLKYSVENYTTILCGLEWVIVREPFRQKKVMEDRFENAIAICFGGTDQFGLTEKTVLHLKDRYPLYELNVITSSSIGGERIDKLILDGAIVHTDISAQRIAEIFDLSSFAILSSSMVCCEALARNTRVLAGYYVDNQVGIYNLFCSRNLIYPLGSLKDSNYLNTLDEALLLQKKTTLLSLDYSNQKEKYIEAFKSLCK